MGVMSGPMICGDSTVLPGLSIAAAYGVSGIENCAQTDVLETYRYGDLLDGKNVIWTSSHS